MVIRVYKVMLDLPPGKKRIHYIEALSIEDAIWRVKAAFNAKISECGDVSDIVGLLPIKESERKAILDDARAFKVSGDDDATR